MTSARGRGTEEEFARKKVENASEKVENTGEKVELTRVACQKRSTNSVSVNERIVLRLRPRTILEI
jgi:hypothetical protein